MKNKLINILYQWKVHFLFAQNYELRRYPAAKWVCTKENDVDPMADPMHDWETKVPITM